jgi:hypothetical protein
MAAPLPVPPPLEPSPKSLAEVLESMPPNSQSQISDPLTPVSGGSNSCRIVIPDLQLHCNSDRCNGTRTFRVNEEKLYLSDGWNYEFLKFNCLNCESNRKTFALVLIVPRDKKQNVRVFKLGETPAFGPPIPSRVITLIGPDRELFLLGRQAENLGLGIGAFAYYRRVVEHQKSRILSEIGRVAKRLGAPPDKLKLFDLAEKENQFTKAIDIVKPAIPDGLLINGQNPLTLLYAPLSEGIHELTDEQCLELATSIRVVLTELAERTSRALQDKKELDDAVSRLLNREARPTEAERKIEQ